MNTINTLSAQEANPIVSDIHVYIIHGFMATPYDHWFQWIKENLEERGILVKVLTLPDSSAPNPSIWQQALSEDIEPLNENTFLVAHSLGCISLLTYLQDRADDKTVGGIILVSGFESPLEVLPQLDNFVKHQVNYKKITRMVKQRSVIGSLNDPIVSYHLTKKVAKNLKADLYTFDNAGHFLAEDGYHSFPFLLEVLLKMLTN